LEDARAKSTPLIYPSLLQKQKYNNNNYEFTTTGRSSVLAGEINR